MLYVPEAAEALVVETTGASVVALAATMLVAELVRAAVVVWFSKRMCGE